MSTHPSLSQVGFLLLSIVTIVSLPQMLPYSFHCHTDCSPRPEKVGGRGEGKGVHRRFRSVHTSLVPWHDSRNRLSSHLTRDILATLSQGRQLWFGAMVTKGCDSEIAKKHHPHQLPEIAKNTVLINYHTSTCGKTGKPTHWDCCEWELATGRRSLRFLKSLLLKLNIQMRVRQISTTERQL